MPKQPKDTTDSPKRGNYKLRKDRKRKELAKKHSQDSDSDDDDSSSDYYPGDDVPEMDNRELQKFMQKIFPSKGGKNRLKQLEKIDKLVAKEDVKNKKLSKKTQEKDVEEEEETDEETDIDEDIELDCEGFPECEDEELDEVMKEMLNNNMKFNIVFTVGGNGGMPSMQFGEDYEEEEYDFDGDSEDDEEDEEDGKNKDMKLEDKKYDDVTEEEWLELARKQEKEMKKNGTFYSTKYQKGNKILFKKKGWNDFKTGKITSVNRSKTRSKVTYDLKLDKKFKGKSIYKKILSGRIKNQEEVPEDSKDSKDIFSELQELIKTKEGAGKDAMEKKFAELCKAQEEKELILSKKKEKKLKRKIL